MSKYLAKIIANDQEGLQMISACVSGSKTKVDNIKYLASSKVFLLSIERTKIESDQMNKKINSVCRFDFVDKVKSKNINQSDPENILELFSINIFKKNDNFEILLLFLNNGVITLSTEVVEVTMEDIKKIDD